MRYKNLNKVIVPHVIPMVEESMHSNGKTRGATLGRKSFKEGVSPDVIGGMEAATTFIVPHQTP